jgi:hypothetical protein
MQSAQPIDSRRSSETKLAILLCLLLAMLISIEYLARAMHDHRSATVRVEDGVRNALLIRQSPDHRQLLFAGNSLIYDDLSQSELQQALGSGFLIHTAGVPGSTYYDWSYGLHALFARGSQPDVLIFSISPSQFLRGPAATPMPVALLWNLREIVAYQREQRLDLTQVSELLLEHYSTFYSLRNTIRIFVRKSIPGYEPMVNDWSAAGLSHAVTEGPETPAIYSDKLARLATECGVHTRLILIISPTHQLEDEELEPDLKDAAEHLGIAVVEPIAEREWPLEKFREDHYHLTPPAAAEFSRLVAADLRQKLAYATVRAAGQ